MPLHLDVPDEFFDAKPFYRTRADAEAALPDIKNHIKTTGEPHSWRHHTHSKPVAGARIVYIGKFDLPKSHQAPDRHAPCPCCSPTSPKYAHSGKIAWFPDEHVIRMIGPDCFKTLNPEGHWEALAQFDREEAERRTISYLVANLHLAAKVRTIIGNAETALTAIDDVHTTLQNRISEIVRVDLWRHVGRGSLDVHVEGRRLRRSRDGSEEVQTFLDVQQLFQFPGFKMFSRKTSNLSTRAKSCSTRLGFVDFGDEIQDRIREMTPQDLAKAARTLSNGITTIETIFEDAESIRTGFRPLSISNLKGWTQHPGCPVSLFIGGDSDNFYIGVSEYQQMRIPLPPQFWRSFADVPQIATVAKWNAE